MATTAPVRAALSPPSGPDGVRVAPPRGGRPRDPAAIRSLAQLVEDQIVPRLLRAHPARPIGAPDETDPAGLGVERFAPMTLHDDPAPLLAHVDALLARGVAVDIVLLDLLAPTARLLGRWWEEDRCDFVTITLALWRLRDVMRAVTGRTAPARPRTGRRALFAAFPGDQHEFGAMMVNETFQRHGWRSELLVGADMPGLLGAVADRAFDLVGLTISCDVHVARLPSAILALRSVSRNPRMAVMIGGRVPAEDSGLVERVGADGTAGDAHKALQVAEALVDSAAHRIACN